MQVLTFFFSLLFRPTVLESSSEYIFQDSSFSKRKKAKHIDSAASRGGEVASSEFVSLEDLAPLAMEKIEALSIEGLRIQSGMSDEEAPSNITPQSIGDISALEGKFSENALSLGLEGTGGLQLLDVKSKDVEDVDDGLMSLSLTLDEWMRLDSGLIEDEGEITDRTAKILAAHHANSANLVRDGQKKGKRGNRSWGLLGNNFTVAIMVQLRDPLRNFEPVGTPMLALIQVERVFVPPKPKVYGNVSLKAGTETDEERKTENKELVLEESKAEECEVASISQYKINEVHVTGFKTEPEPVPDKRNPWSNGLHQQSGSRWLIAAGMGKGNKHPLLNSKMGNSSSAKPGKGDTLWSISSRVQGNGSKRNPNILLSNKTSRMR